MREEQLRRRAVGIAEDVLAGLLVDDALVDVHGAAGLLAMRLGHEGGVHLVPQRRLAHGALEQEDLVGQIERIAVQEVDFHLRRAVLVDQRVDVDVLRLAEVVDVVEERIELVDGVDAVGLAARFGAARTADRRLAADSPRRCSARSGRTRVPAQSPAASRAARTAPARAAARCAAPSSRGGRPNRSSRGSPARWARPPRARRARCADRRGARCRSRRGSSLPRYRPDSRRSRSAGRCSPAAACLRRAANFCAGMILPRAMPAMSGMMRLHFGDAAFTEELMDVVRHESPVVSCCARSRAASPNALNNARGERVLRGLPFRMPLHCQREAPRALHAEGFDQSVVGHGLPRSVRRPSVRTP